VGIRKKEKKRREGKREGDIRHKNFKPVQDGWMVDREAGKN
jgi:hypothetical protein